MRTFTDEELKQMSDGFPPSDCGFEEAITVLSQECLKLRGELEDTEDETLVMQCATCRHYDRKHHHCKYHDSLTNPSYVCVACWESKYSKRKGEVK